MKKMTLQEISQAVKGRLIQGRPDQAVPGVSIDSRTIKPGELFTAIVGERLDGHDFIPDAVAGGAAAVIADRQLKGELSGSKTRTGLILVEDTTAALQELALYYRQKFKDLKVVAVTGSAGKTTTKDITARLLAARYRVKKTRGNYNNYYGLPLTLLELSGEEDFAVLELGMSKLGEIKLLAEIALPRIGVITNVGPTHLEDLGTVENVARGKGELISSLPENGLAVLNYDNSHVREMKRLFSGRKIIYYGMKPGAELRAESIQTDPDGGTGFQLNYQGERVKLRLNKPGEHNVYNALAAIAVARESGISWPEIRTALMELELSAFRWEEERLDNGTLIINDSYNANPISMEAAVATALSISRGRTVVVLGAMLELGEGSDAAHLELGRFVCRQGVDVLITTGSPGDLIARGAVLEGMAVENVLARKGNKEAAAAVLEVIHPGDTVLIKGSRGIKMEEIAQELLARGREG